MQTTLISMCGRDRLPLVERCLASVRAELEGVPVLFHVDSACVEFDREWVQARGVTFAITLELPADMDARQRVAAMRCHAAQLALGMPEVKRLLFLDSDVELLPGFRERLEVLWGARELVGAGAVGLASWPGFLDLGFRVRLVPELDAYVATHGLGAALAFPVDERLERVVAAGVPLRASWDSHLSGRLGPVLSPMHAPLVHLGSGSGISAARGRASLDFA